MTIFKRILISLPLALGMSLFMSSAFALLDAYGAAEEYREIIDPIIDGYAEQGQAPEASVEERIDLRSELFFIRVEMDHGSYTSLRMRFFGGLALLGIGAWIVHRAKGWVEHGEGTGSPKAAKKTAEQGAPRGQTHG